MRTDVQRQPSLFDLDEVDVAPLDGLRRLALDATSWVDHRPGWLQGSGTVFDELLATGRFHQRWRTVWEHTVLEPRLTAHWGVEDDGAGTPDVLRRLAGPLSAHYGIEFDSVFVNLYRDGRDSVAWHRDRIGHSHAEPLVVTISLGARRRFLLRPRSKDGAGGRTVEVSVGGGDLLVMGGRCQHDWEHSVPKQASVTAARMSITMRHSGHWPHVPVPTVPGWVKAEWARARITADG